MHAMAGPQVHPDADPLVQAAGGRGRPKGRLTLMAVATAAAARKAVPTASPARAHRAQAWLLSRTRPLLLGRARRPPRGYFPL